VGSFWWRDIIGLSKNFLKIATYNVKKGNSVIFWKDLWNLGVLQWKSPQLYSFVRYQNISVKVFSLERSIEISDYPFLLKYLCNCLI